MGKRFRAATSIYRRLGVISVQKKNKEKLWVFIDEKVAREQQIVEHKQKRTN